MYELQFISNASVKCDRDGSSGYNNVSQTEFNSLPGKWCKLQCIIDFHCSYTTQGISMNSRANICYGILLQLLQLASLISVCKIQYKILPQLLIFKYKLIINVRTMTVTKDGSRASSHSVVYPILFAQRERFNIILTH